MRRLIKTAVLMTALGAGVGLVLAAREIVRQHYLAQGLWRTVLWTGGRGATVGALAGMVACPLLLALVAAWVGLIARAQSGDERGHAGRLADTVSGWPAETILLISLMAGAFLAAAPVGGGTKFGIPQLDLMIGLMSLLCIAGTGLATEVALSPPSDSTPADWFSLRWLLGLAFAYVLLALHIWARASSALVLASALMAAAAICCAAYFGLRGPSRFVYDRYLRPLRMLFMGRAGSITAGAMLTFVLALWTSGWIAARKVEAKARERGYNVLIIGVDALRADRVSLISDRKGDRDLTPNISAAFRPHAAIYVNAIAQAPWTLPAFSSIFTGVYPEEHGAENRGSTLAPFHVTLAEILREAGYRTLGISSGAYVTTLSGLSQGFEVFDESQALGQWTVSSDKVTARAISLLREYRSQPFFMFVHYFDCHWIYQDHDEFGYSDWYTGWVRDPAQGLNQEDFRAQVGGMGPTHGMGMLTKEDVVFLGDLYDEEVAYVDAQLGRLFAFMDESDLWRDTLVILIADHGEELLEHGFLGHQLHLYEESVHVPLLIARPGGGSRLVPHPVETRALFATVLDFLQAPAPTGHRGDSLLHHPAPINWLSRSATHSVATFRGSTGWTTADVWWTSIRDGRWKLVKEHLRGGVMLFDLQEDPGESRNCAAANPETRRRLERELDRLDAEVKRMSPKGPVPEADEAQKRRLKSLGYL